MDDFQKKYLEEATDLVNSLESTLLAIEKNTEDESLIEKIFRIMHSLKGGGAMFGFNRISEFTHNLENIYDNVREGRLKIDKELLDLTFASVDMIKCLLNKEEQKNNSLLNDYQLLNKKIAIFADNAINNENQQDELNPIDNTNNETNETKTSKGKTFYLYINPQENIFDDGTNLLYILDEICNLGKTKIYPNINKIPDLEIFKPELCYISWDIILYTENSFDEINEIFLFVEDICEIKISEMCNSDLLDNAQIISLFDKYFSEHSNPDLNDLISFLKKETNCKPKEKKDATRSTTQDIKESTITSIRVDAEKIDQLMNLVSELVSSQASLTLYANQNKTHQLIQITENFENITRQLRDIAFNISLVPIESLITRFNRLVRDLAAETQKKVILITEGTETELDKTIIQSLTEPIMHIIRNCIDHGIEPVDERIAKNKPAQGVIKLKAFYSSANVHIIIQDDGRGVDLNKVKKKAIKNGYIAHDANLTEKELLNLIFIPGFSTAKQVTDISGRGVGMDVVKRKIEEIRGEVEIESASDKGVKMTLKLPLTLSIIDGLLVKIDDINYLLSISVIDKLYEINHKDVQNSFRNVITIEDKQIPFYYLRDELSLGTPPKKEEAMIVVKYDDTNIGLIVDKVIGEYQAVIKPLGRHYHKNELFSGATILGDGSIALVFDTNKMIKQFAEL